MSETIDFFSAAFAKTETGQQEIQKRSLGLSPLVRRVLVLVDGQRSGKELATFAAGSNIDVILGELVEKGCIEPKVREKADKADRQTSASEAAAPSPTSSALSQLVPADERTPAQNEMARNFMINTVNSIFGQHTRLSLIESIAGAQTTESLRKIYLKWEEAMAENRIGAKRLPEFQSKLFEVL